MFGMLHGFLAVFCILSLTASDPVPGVFVQSWDYSTNCTDFLNVMTYSYYPGNKCLHGNGLAPVESYEYTFDGTTITNTVCLDAYDCGPSGCEKKTYANDACLKKDYSDSQKVSWVTDTIQKFDSKDYFEYDFGENPTCNVAYNWPIVVHRGASCHMDELNKVHQIYCEKGKLWKATFENWCRGTPTSVVEFQTVGKCVVLHSGPFGSTYTVYTCDPLKN